MNVYRYFNPPSNRVLEKFFARYPKFHLFKFLLQHRKHRVVIYLLLKLMYWCWFKAKNRIRLIDKQKIPSIKPESGEKSFLIVENHSANADVMMHMAAWAHLGIYTFVFTLEGSFRGPFPLAPMFTHFVEMVPRYGRGISSINRMVKRLRQGDVVNIFPAGTYATGKYANCGLVQEAHSGAARVAYQYWKQTGEKLVIQPVCSIGGNIAYPPRRRGRHPNTIPNHQIDIKFGEPFTLDFSDNPDFAEISEKTTFLQQRIAQIWGQKHLIPNWQIEYRKKRQLAKKSK